MIKYLKNRNCNIFNFLLIVLLLSLIGCSSQIGIEKQNTSIDDIEFLINSLSNNNPNIRWDACFELGKKKNIKALDSLIQTLSDKDKSVSVCAIWALGEIKDKRAIEHLTVFLSDKDPFISTKAFEAIEKINPGFIKKSVKLQQKTIVKQQIELNKKRNSASLKKTAPQIKSDLNNRSTDLAILINGKFHEKTFNYFVDYLKIPEKDIKRLTPYDFNENNLKNIKLLVIPTSGLYLINQYPYMEKILAEYVTNGGNIFCFSQMYKDDYNILPVPDNEILEVFGYQQDEGFKDRRVLIEDYHPILSSFETTKLTTIFDGYIYKWPKNSKVILLRNSLQLPEYIIYQYYGGFIALTNLYNDYSQNLGIDKGTKIVRDSITWLRNPNILLDIVRPEDKEIKTIVCSTKIRNTSMDTTNYVWLYVYTPDRRSKEEKKWHFQLNPNEEKDANIEVNLSNKSELGIWGMGYKLSKDSNFETVVMERNYSQGFVVRKNLIYWELKKAEKNKSVESLISFFLDNDIFIREKALKALHEIDPQWRKSSLSKKAVSEFIHSLKDGNSDKQNKILTALELIDPQWRRTDDAQKVVSEFIHSLKDSNPDKQNKILTALELIDPQWRRTDDAQKVVSELIDILKINFSEKYEIILITLANIDPQWHSTNYVKNAVTVFIDILADTSDSQTRIKLIYILGNMKNSKAVDPLMVMLKDKEPTIREKAAWALGEIKDERAVKSLISAMNDKDSNVRKSAAIARMKINAGIIKK
ncbi:MAG: HEAT repeat domain-containing protein [Candidatus Firestonebacteria bacterium]|nr:HEAT repeat domain-containing protein [Candidatus Firestonebacteria bacterium]